MRNNLTLIAISLAAATLSATATADVEIYGKGFVTIENYDNGSTTITETNNNASRIGFKGSEDLGNGLKAVFKIEREVDLTGETSELKARNTYVGIKGNFGQAVVGIHDTPTKDMSKKLDLFNDMAGDYKNVVEGETRAKNVLLYTAPKFNNITINIMAINAETAEDSSMTDSLSMSATWQNEGLTVGVSQDLNVVSGSVKKDYLDITRVMAAYTVGSLTVGGFVQQASEGDSYVGQYDRDSYHVSAAYKLEGGYTLKAQYSSGSDNLIDEESTMTSLGVDYKLSKNTKLMGFYTGFEKTVDGTVNKEFDSLGVGIEYKF
jgi:predicted porin